MRNIKQKTLIMFLSLLFSSAALGAGFSFGGFSLGGDSGDSGNSLDIGNLIDAGKNAATLLDEVDLQEELEFGQEASGLLIGNSPLLNNPAVQTYINSVGRWLSMHAERPDLPWRFAVLDSKNVNAYSAPGGYVFITSALYQQLHSESELAGVLAHEIAHVVQRHHIKALKKNAASGLAASLATAKTQTMLAKEAANGMRDIWNSGLDKDYEYEADLMGIIIATRAGYDPYGLVAVLQTLDSLNPNDESLALLFKTHPLPAQRLKELEPYLDLIEPYAGQPDLPERFAAVGRKTLQPAQKQ